jgi:hypothetical protein
MWRQLVNISRQYQARIQGGAWWRAPPIFHQPKKQLTAYHLSTAGNPEAGNHPTCGESDAE